MNRHYVAHSISLWPKVVVYLHKRAFYCLLKMELKAMGKIIQTRRKSRSIVQGDLADIAGISLRTLRDIEKGVANPELQTLMSICNVLGLEIKIEVMK